MVKLKLLPGTTFDIAEKCDICGVDTGECGPFTSEGIKGVVYICSLCSDFEETSHLSPSSPKKNTFSH